MLADVLGAYLETLTEREFDAPLMAILRSSGFRDIHFLHGSFEFGKDFIAKRSGSDKITQYSIQSKAGDISLGDWRQVRVQIDEMRTNNLAHPNFDTALPRRTVFLTTDRLIGGAPLSAQEYSSHLEHVGEENFEVWDRDTIIEMIGLDPELGLAGVLADPLLRLVGEISANEVSLPILENYSRSWLEPGAATPWHAAIVAAVLTNRLRRGRRLDLACLTSLLLLRAATWHAHGSEDSAGLDELIDVAGRMFAEYAEELWILSGQEALEPDKVLGDRTELANWVVYPVRSLRIAEILSLLALRARREAPKSAEQIEEYVTEFVRCQPGVAHPISDNWAVSLLPVGLVLGNRDMDLFESWVTEVGRWVADYYDDGEGLAALDASPEVEIEYLVGGPLEHVVLQPRNSSLVAAALLDLVSVFERGDLFDILRNEFLAVNASPEVIEVPDTKDQYVRDGSSVTREPNAAYDDLWSPDCAWKSAGHHRRSPESYRLARLGREWEHIALAAVVRDRWFCSTLRSYATES